MRAARPDPGRRGAALQLLALVLAGAVVVLPGAAAQGQAIGDPVVVRALDLEANGDVGTAAALYRGALGGPEPVVALLGLERTYAELGRTESLLVPLDSVVRRLPTDEAVRAVQLRTLQALGREAELRAAAGEWSRLAPGSAAPYRELARLLLAQGRIAATDSVLGAAQRALGGLAGLWPEVARLRAAMEAWEESASAWRTALRTEPWLAEGAAHALERTPERDRDAVRDAFLAGAVEVAPRSALASLEARWGAPGRGWAALRDLPPDSASAAAWLAFADRAEAEGRWTQARLALEAALAWRADDAVRHRAAVAALESGDARAVLTLAPLPAAGDVASHASTLVPLHVAALARLGRADEAAALARRYDLHLPPALQLAVAREIAMGWVRAGDLAQARAVLVSAGAGADSSSAAGWLALFGGDARAARALLTAGEERSAEVALALAVLTRHREPHAPSVGAAFLALARGDSAGAAARFERAADESAGAASLLALVAARLHLADGDTVAAHRTFARVAERHGDTPEAPEALLALGRIALARGERAGAAAQLERLILEHPASALVPAARAELELLRSSGPAR